jgi:hypothetical protein
VPCLRMIEDLVDRERPALHCAEWRRRAVLRQLARHVTIALTVAPGPLATRRVCAAAASAS